MIVKPKIRGFICTTAHPEGCERKVQEQIEYVKKNGPVPDGPKTALIVGASTGYGLSSRIAAAFGSGAKTVGVIFERPAEGKRTATAGWYNTVAFEKIAAQEGLYAATVNGDAFSDEVKEQTIARIKEDVGPIDLFIYSLASPRRLHPKTGVLHKSTLKPLGGSYTNKSIDMSRVEVSEVTLPAATDEEVANTVAVMGGEDWEMWVQALKKEGLISDRFTTVAYSYVGPSVTNPVYRNGTIGAAKDDLEATARQMDNELKTEGGRAFVSVNKAIVTQSSSAIPFIPLYFLLLMKVMKGKGVHEDSIHQIYRLFAERLYTGGEIPVDEKGRIRIDDLEMREDIQKDVQALWEKVSKTNVKDLADVEGYEEDFLKLFGFGFEDVNYEEDVDIERPLGSVSVS